MLKENFPIVKSWKEFKELERENSEYVNFNDFEVLKFGEKRILLIAPHRSVGSFVVDFEGRKVKITVGERGTDVLAVVAAYYVGGSCILVNIPRFKADFSRDPNLIGEGYKTRLFVDGERRMIPVHTDSSYKASLEKFHEVVEELNPKFLISVHGMVNKKFDLLLGFGKEFQYIGGKENAFNFKSLVKEKAEKHGLSAKVAVSTKLLMGESEYNLKFHVEEKGRLGVLAEFNRLGRVTKDGVPSEDYQKLSCLLAETADELLNG